MQAGDCSSFGELHTMTGRAGLALLLGLLVTPMAAAQPRTDCYGDPLPDGAVGRLGTARLRHGHDITVMAFAPDGRSLASSDDGGWLCVWDVATGREQWAVKVGDRTCA